jgi:hypothetical protein
MLSLQNGKSRNGLNYMTFCGLKDKCPFKIKKSIGNKKSRKYQICVSGDRCNQQKHNPVYYEI